MRPLPGLRRLPFPGSRLRGAGGGEGGAGARRADTDRRIEDAPVEPILPAASQFFYRNKLEYSFTQTPSGPALGFHKAGRWDEVLEVERWLTTDLGNAIRRTPSATGRARRTWRRDQAEHSGYLRHLVYREGRNTGQVLVLLVTAPGEKFERDYLVEVLRRFPRSGPSTGRSTTSPRR